MYTFLCEDSMEGIFSGIYEAWAGKYNRNEIVMKAGEAGNYQLFMEYKQIEKNTLFAQKVKNTIIKRFGMEAYEQICYALWSSAEDKADVVYRMVKYGIEHACGYELCNHYTEASIQRSFELFRASYNEAHHYLGFVRFAELKNGVLYARIRPKNQVLVPVAAHFADRLPGENWILHDIGRQQAVVHERFCQCFVAEEKLLKNIIQYGESESETEFQEMWKSFCKSISIESRENLKLQQQNLPLRFREYML